MLILIRGLPGSGKSTKAKEICKEYSFASICEADDYFIKNGRYEFNPKEISVAHAFCQHKAFSILDESQDAIVVVSNTFTQVWEMLPYIRYAQKNNISWTIIECDGEYDNIHNVPKESISKMNSRWESIDSLKKEVGWIEYESLN